MDRKNLLRNKKGLGILLTTISLFVATQNSISTAQEQPGCLDQAIREIERIRELPELEFFHTLDGQRVLVDEFFKKCLRLFPQCCLFRKFYYWKSEIRVVVSVSSEGGLIRHKIRAYHNCLSTCCSRKSGPRKTHGDVSEFYDEEGDFMGLAVYMGLGKYCSLPYDGYGRRWSYKFCRNH